MTKILMSGMPLLRCFVCLTYTKGGLSLSFHNWLQMWSGKAALSVVCMEARSRMATLPRERCPRWWRTDRAAGRETGGGWRLSELCSWGTEQSHVGPAPFVPECCRYLFLWKRTLTGWSPDTNHLFFIVHIPVAGRLESVWQEFRKRWRTLLPGKNHMLGLLRNDVKQP